MQPSTYALDTTWRTLLADLGLVPANVLRRAELPDDLLRQPNVRLEPKQFYRLWESAEQEKGDVLFPIRVCEAVRVESFSPALFAALCSSNLTVAARRIATYKKLIGPLRMEVREKDDTLTVEFVWPAGASQPPKSLVIMELLFCVALARIGTRKPVTPIDVMTTDVPPQIASFETFLGARILQGPRHAVRFAKADALDPFLTSNEPLWMAFEPDLRQRLADLDTSENFTTRVRAALHEAIPGGLTTTDAIAAKLAVSKRTLQRRIGADGTSFQEVLRETREALARHYLEKTSLPTSEISFLLGFDEQNSFYRAFRSWTGKTPDNVRRQQVE